MLHILILQSEVGISAILLYFRLRDFIRYFISCSLPIDATGALLSFLLQLLSAHGHFQLSFIAIEEASGLSRWLQSSCGSI